MDFEKRKAATIAAISSTSPDKSPKGNIDEPIIPLLTAINNHPSYFTTSSCSGRISIFSHKPNKSKGGSWLFISHHPADPNSVLHLFFPSPELTQSDSDLPTKPNSVSNPANPSGSGVTELTQSESDDPTEGNSVGNPTDPNPDRTNSTELAESTRSESGELVFRFEPLIIAVECKDVGSAQNLVSIAISCGFRESGITSVSGKRVIIVIRCSIRLEVPLGCKERILVSKEYLRYLVEVGNEKMGANWKRTQGFMEGLRKNGFVADGLCRGGGDGGGDDGRQCDQVKVEMSHLENRSGSLGNPRFSLSVAPLEIVGEPAERLFLWGHSSCSICDSHQDGILIYGGFGGIGRHARRSDCLLFDPSSCRLSILHVKSSPSPRVGHTSSIVGGLMIVIGGRADPANILDELWIFDFAKTEWILSSKSNNVFTPRHRHAAAVLGSRIYLFGGLDKSLLFSSLLVLDVDTLQWSEVHASGEQPSSRHSHSLVAQGKKLYLFGGYDGERALGDLYSFDVQECLWEKVKTVGRSPYPRFSHSMFVYKDYLGIIGGCPVRQHCQELSLLNLKTSLWKHVILDSVSKELFVRSTTNVVNDDLVVIGGGASCYAFGTKFSEPVKINLLSLSNIFDHNVLSLVDEEQTTYQNGELITSEPNNGLILDDKESTGPIGDSEKNAFWVLRLQKKYAKLGKDILKKFGWLDLGRKVYSSEDGSSLYFPVTVKFCAIFPDEHFQTITAHEGFSDLILSNTSTDSCSSALELLVSFGATKHADEVVAMKKAPVSPFEVMREAVALLLMNKGLSEELLEQLPTRWERLGDIVVLPVTSFQDSAWDTVGSEVWGAVAKALGARRLARQGRVASTGTRDSRLEILVGDSGWVEHRENGILYSFDATKCMFSWGNLSEKLRMSRLDCKDQVIVDLFAGIGYFTLPFLVRGHAKLVYACEWNPHALEALQRNLKANSVSDRCIVLEGDNRGTAPEGVANRVCLGLLPSSEGSWITAVRALRSEGGTLHIHGNVKDTEETEWTQHVVKSISEIAKSKGHCWSVSLVHLERVKWYAPHIRHLVADVRCQQSQT